MPLALAIVAGVTALAGGIFSAISGSEAAKAKQAEITQEKENRKTTYENDVEELNLKYDQTVAEYNDQLSQTKTAIANTSTAREQDAASAATLNVKSTDIAYQELAEQIASGEQSVGSAVQSASQTGFRNTGTNEKNIEQVKKTVERQLSTAREQVKLSAASAFAEASSNYFSQSVTISNYQANLETINRYMQEAEDTYNLNKENLEEEYNADIALLDLEYDNAAYSWLDAAADTTTAVANAVSSGSSTYSALK